MGGQGLGSVTRRVAWVVLCEDEQHFAFARRFLELLGRPELRQTRKVLGPGHAGVREKLPNELEMIRKRGDTAALLVILDADGHPVEDRKRYVLERCPDDSRPDARTPVAILVPERNIETWIAWLNGKVIDASIAYPKLRHERDCKPAVERLKEYCDAKRLPDAVPASLRAACAEFDRLLGILTAQG